MDTYRKFKEMTDDGQLETNVDSNNGIVGVYGTIQGVTVKAQYDPENTGLYAVSIGKFEDFARMIAPDEASVEQAETKRD